MLSTTEVDTRPVCLGIDCEQRVDQDTGIFDLALPGCFCSSACEQKFLDAANGKC